MATKTVKGAAAPARRVSRAELRPNVRELYEARDRVNRVARHTPLQRSQWLSERMGCDVWLKLECWQRTNSFKMRGAYNAVARYVERWLGAELSSNGLLEAQWYLFSAVFLLGASATLRRDEHVRVDVLFGRLKPKGRALVDLVGTLVLLLPFCGLAIWTSMPGVIESWSITEQSPDPGGLPRYPLKAVVPLAFALLPVPFREWLERRGVAFVEVPDNEFDSMGTNVLALGPRRCLLIAGTPKSRAALEPAGAEVVIYDGSEISVKGAGGPTCLTRPLARA